MASTTPSAPQKLPDRRRGPQPLHLREPGERHRQPPGSIRGGQFMRLSRRFLHAQLHQRAQSACLYLDPAVLTSRVSRSTTRCRGMFLLSNPRCPRCLPHAPPGRVNLTPFEPHQSHLPTIFPKGKRRGSATHLCVLASLLAGAFRENSVTKFENHVLSSLLSILETPSTALRGSPGWVPLLFASVFAGKRRPHRALLIPRGRSAISSWASIGHDYSSVQGHPGAKKIPDRVWGGACTPRKI
jgi:hypothetical protein